MQSKVIATVHDSIVIDATQEEALEVAKTAHWIMENLPIPFTQYNHKGKVITYPITADVDIGGNYKDVFPLDEEFYKKFKTPKGYSKYFVDQSFINDNFDRGRITEEQRDEALQALEAAQERYFEIV